MAEQQKTTITIERPMRVGVPEKIAIDVPFSQAEIDAIQDARLAQALLMPRALQGSGTSREIAVTHHVPWGYSLTDREKALREVKKIVGYIEATMTPEREKFLQQEEIDLIRHIQARLGILLP